MNKNIFFFILFYLFCFNTIAQEQKPEVKEELKDDLTRLNSGEDLNVLYRNESSFAVFVHSAGGIGLAYRRGKHVTARRKRLFEIEVQNFKHPKEIKSINSYYPNSKGFVYGKLNSLFIIRPGIGIQNRLYEKSDKKSVEIRYSYFIGGTITLAKPVYLEIKRVTSNPFAAPTTERYDPKIHSIDQIYAKASYFRGIENTRIYPAGYAKFALSFEYADRYNKIKAIETGAVVDIYPQILPIMAYNKNQQVFISLYLKMIWGKRWF